MPPSEHNGGRWILSMGWLDLLFAHWPVPCEVLRPLIPASLGIDVFDGQLHQTDGCRTRAAAQELRAAIDLLDAEPSDRHLLIGVLNAFVNNGTEEARCDS